MKRFESILASNQLDRHGDILARGALESAAELFKRNYLSMNVEHDPRIAPVGRFTDAWIEDRSDGVSVLRGIGELFEEGDELPTHIDKTIVERSYEPGHLQVVFDRSYESEPDITEIRDIASRFGTTPRFEAKKAFEPLSILTIAGSFALGAIAAGFFKEIGSDSYKWLKNKLATLIVNQRAKSKEQLLVFAFTVTHAGRSVLVQTILPNPNEEDIDRFLKDAVYDLDRIPAKHFAPKNHLSRLVYFYENGTLTFKYAVRADGFPLTYRVAK